jgi:ribosomal-protein-alanine N-acetyltransferase
MLPDTFRTTRLLLRPVAVEDTDAIFDTYVQDEEVARYVIWRPHRNRRETQTYIERCVATLHEFERTYMLVGCDDNVIRGAFSLRQRAPHRLDCGYALAHRWWGQGLMDRGPVQGCGLGLTPAFDFSHWRNVRRR